MLMVFLDPKEKWSGTNTLASNTSTTAQMCLSTESLILGLGFDRQRWCFRELISLLISKDTSGSGRTRCTVPNTSATAQMCLSTLPFSEQDLTDCNRAFINCIISGCYIPSLATDKYRIFLPVARIRRVISETYSMFSCRSMSLVSHAHLTDVCSASRS